MTLSSTTQKLRYSGNGSNKNFAITFDFKDDNTFVEVWVRDESIPGAITESLKSNPTHYTISGGNVVFGTAPTANQKVIIRRVLPLKQELDFIENGPFPSEGAEDQYDRIVMQIQQLQEQLDRAIKFAKTSIQSDVEMTDLEADKVPVVNADGDGFVFLAPDDLSAVAGALTAANNLSDLDDVAAARDNLGLGDLALLDDVDPPQVTGSRGTPYQVVAASGITAVQDKRRQFWFVKGSGGAVTIAANPQISAGNVVGQELILIGRDDTNTVTIANGNGLELDGNRVIGLGTVLGLFWDGTVWLEGYFNEL